MNDIGQGKRSFQLSLLPRLAVLGRAGEDYVLRKEVNDAKACTERLQSARSSAWCSVTRRSGWGWDGREASEAGDICIFMADLCCAAETNTTL